MLRFLRIVESFLKLNVRNLVVGNDLWKIDIPTCVTRSGVNTVSRGIKFGLLTRRFQKDREKVIAMHAKTSPKLFWNHVNRKIKIKRGIPQLEVITNPAGASSILTKNDYEKAEALLHHFSSVFVNEPPGNVPKAHPHQVQSSLDDLLISEDTIMKKLNNLNVSKSPGPDKVHPKILKLLSSSVSKPLNVIFNTSLRTGILPDDWKKAHVSAILRRVRGSTQTTIGLLVLQVLCAKSWSQ